MNSSKSRQSGQSLIETIVAIYILVTVLVAGLGLAVYAVSHGSSNRNQIVANNLAREGIEVIRMFRDSNWLVAEDDPHVEDLQDCTFPNPAPNNIRPCYPEAFGSSNALGRQTPLSNSTAYYHWLVRFEGGDWDLYSPMLGLPSYFLCLQSDGTYQHHSLWGGGCDTGLNYARRISISTGSTAAPFTTDSDNPTAASGHSAEKIITSTVVWQGRRCTPFPTDFFAMLTFDPVTFNTSCKLTITERLTNWKDYE